MATHRPTTRTHVYWWTTALTAGSMAAAAGVYFTHNRRVTAEFRKLGYPDYFPDLLGVAKVLGSVALVVPGLRRAKEWAYAGFAFTYLAAVWSHAARRRWVAVLTPLPAMALLAVSYATRPPDRHVVRHTPGR